MKLVLVSFWDYKANAFSEPMHYVSKAAAIREFYDAAKSEKTKIFAHPEDYSLYMVGVFDTETGVITDCTKPVYLAKAVDVTQK